VTEPANPVIDWADPTTEYFWESARAHRLVIQQCTRCLTHQFYPRPFCLACDSDDVTWVASSGRGTVYSRTTIHLPASPDLGFTGPYIAAIVELDEGPRLLTNLTSSDSVIGGRVQVAWRDREGQAPVPVFDAIGPDERSGL
jgi:uncharacterized OB-fold protein